MGFGNGYVNGFLGGGELKVNPVKKILSHLHLKTEGGQKPSKTGYLLIVALIGILFLLVSSIFQEESSPPEQTSNWDEPRGQPTEEETFLAKDNKSSDLDDIEKQYQNDLTNMLENISGVSDVEVMINLDATHKRVYEKNLIVGTQTTEEQDQNGGQRSIDDLTEEQQVVVVRQGDEEVPLIVQTVKPTVRGVLVVANGVERIELKQWVTEAVSRVLDVPPHRISIMPRGEGEG